MIILIPCYEPDQRLLALIEALRVPDPFQPIVVVDDGSGPGYAPVFDAARAAGCDVIGHPQNRGKGLALKKGLALIAERYAGEDVVCADCDGQHTPADIQRVAAELRRHADSIVLGSRLFVGDVPPRNRFGNTLTRAVFDRLTGQRLQDTQTGLRGYPAALLPWLQSIPGERFEYELEVLLAARKEDLPVVEVPIATVYLDGNRSTHFRPVSDSVRVYVPFLKFSASSVSAFVLDTALFFVFIHITGSLIFSVVAARLASATANYAINGRLVFLGDRGAPSRRTGLRYATVASALLVANYTLIRTLTWLALPLLAAKPLTEATLFLTSYRAQRRFVFGGGNRPSAAVSTPASTDITLDSAPAT